MSDDDGITPRRRRPADPNYPRPFYLSTIQVARLLDVHPVTVRRWHQLDIPPVPSIRVGNYYRYAMTDVASYLRKLIEESPVDDPRVDHLQASYQELSEAIDGQ